MDNNSDPIECFGSSSVSSFSHMMFAGKSCAAFRRSFPLGAWNIYGKQLKVAENVASTKLAAENICKSFHAKTGSHFMRRGRGWGIYAGLGKTISERLAFSVIALANFSMPIAVYGAILNRQAAITLFCSSRQQPILSTKNAFENGSIWRVGFISQL